MRTTTGKCQAEQLWDAADLPCRHPPELVPLLGMDRHLWIKVSEAESDGGSRLFSAW